MSLEDVELHSACTLRFSKRKILGLLTHAPNIKIILFNAPTKNQSLLHWRKSFTVRIVSKITWLIVWNFLFCRVLLQPSLFANKNSKHAPILLLPSSFFTQFIILMKLLGLIIKMQIRGEFDPLSKKIPPIYRFSNDFTFQYNTVFAALSYDFSSYYIFPP